MTRAEVGGHIDAQRLQRGRRVAQDASETTSAGSRPRTAAGPSPARRARRRTRKGRCGVDGSCRESARAPCRARFPESVPHFRVFVRVGVTACGVEHPGRLRGWPTRSRAPSLARHGSPSRSRASGRGGRRRAHGLPPAASARGIASSSTRVSGRPPGFTSWLRSWPSTSSIVMKGTPLSCSTEYRTTMFGWFSRATVRASSSRSAEPVGVGRHRCRQDFDGDVAT